tara:strand:+ start:187 stop:1794 length:1608 start_codon:yes stop_codon:yes gene_type:complete
MSYLALARKWRPKNFRDIVGQEHVVQALTNALDTQKLHHAYLFSGTRGIGKTTIARILAKAFNCQNGITADPCGSCNKCCEVDEGRFLDLIEVDAASKTKVDDTRELLDNVQFAPTAGKYKIYLIDEVHMLSKHSFNALLKTLEEPPPHVKFFLATTDPQKLPVTVLSRCLQFNLKRISPKKILDRLCLICDEENVQFEKKGLAKLARAADGSLRDSLSLLDQAIAYGGNILKDEDIITMLGTVDRKYIDQIMSSIVKQDIKKILATVNDIDDFFPDYGFLLGEIAEILQRIAVIQVVGPDKDSEMPINHINDYAAKISSEDVQLFYQIAIMGKRDIHIAPNPKVGFEMTLIRMLAFRLAKEKEDKTVTRDEDILIVNKIDDLNSIKKEKISAEKMEKSPQIKAKPVWDEHLVWSDLIEKLNISGTSRILADNCALVSRNDNIISLSLDEKSASYRSKDRERVLAKCISEFFDEDLTINIEIDSVKKETPNQEKLRQADEELEAAKKNLKADPGVKELEDLFGVDMNPESVILKN